MTRRRISCRGEYLGKFRRDGCIERGESDGRHPGCRSSAHWRGDKRVSKLTSIGSALASMRRCSVMAIRQYDAGAAMSSWLALASACRTYAGKIGGRARQSRNQCRRKATPGGVMPSFGGHRLLRHACRAALSCRGGWRARGQRMPTILPPSTAPMLMT